MKQDIKQVKFADYQYQIKLMMLDMLHLEPQPVDIPIDRYIELDELGCLKTFIWIEREVVKGCALLFVSPSLRNPAVIDASTDVIWVKPEYRGNSSQFIDGIKEHLQNMGVNYWMISSRHNDPIDKFLEKNEFTPLERVYFCQIK